jgi:PPM family protein phosphatase
MAGTKNLADVRVSGRTDVGRARMNNEDAFLVARARGVWPADGGSSAFHSAAFHDLAPILLAVSDGMGGEHAGEIASALTLDSLQTAVAQILVTSTPDVALRGGFEFANRVVSADAVKPGRTGMGATLTAALFFHPHVYLSTVGDSRAYLMRAGRFTQLTRDQSYAQMLIDSGQLEPDKLDAFPLRNVILQAIGRAASLSLEVQRLEMRRGDRLLLCSDGLSGEVKDAEIADILAQDSDLDQTTEALIAAANDHGGNDNVTVVLAAFDGEPLALPASGDPMTTLVGPPSRGPGDGTP